MKGITWLHLSDLHMKFRGSSDSYDRDIIIETFLNDIQEQISSKDLKFDCIFFSGDIAFSGKSNEYDLAIKSFFDPLLTATGVSKERLFIVPGNHDIDWDNMDRINTVGMREVLKTRRDINDFLRPGRDRHREFEKFDAYSKFLERYLGIAYDVNYEKLFYTKNLEINGYRFAVLGLNSTWMSACYQNNNGKPQDQGKLLIGDVQLRQALKETEGTDIRVAVLHHPLDWLDENIERFEIERQMEAKCDFILHGHWHNAKFYYKESNAGQSIFFPAGALYQGYERPNGYNIVQLDLSTGQGKIIFRRFQNDGPQGPVWMKDIATTGETRDGTIEFPMHRFDSVNSFQSTTPRETSKNETQTKSKKLLLAEDGKNWQNLLTRILLPDYEVDVATSYEDAKNKLHNSYSAVIVNMCLETDNDFLGEAILKAIKEMPQSIPCIVITGSRLPTRGIFERYPFVHEVFTKGGRDERNFPSSNFLDIVKEAVEG